jgi:predicted nucleic acid-binding protein
MSRVFIDSNLWLYLFVGDDEHKLKAVKNLLITCNTNNTIVISFQVLNEVAFNLKKKGFSEENIRSIISTIKDSSVIIDFSVDIILNASKLRERHTFSYWDSLIIACAAASNCKTLYSEDMQDGRVIEGLCIENPFNSSAENSKL